MIDHILTNVIHSTISSGVFSYSFSHHYPIFSTIKNPLKSHFSSNN